MKNKQMRSTIKPKFHQPKIFSQGRLGLAALSGPDKPAPQQPDLRIGNDLPPMCAGVTGQIAVGRHRDGCPYLREKFDVVAAVCIGNAVGERHSQPRRCLAREFQLLAREGVTERE